MFLMMQSFVPTTFTSPLIAKEVGRRPGFAPFTLSLCLVAALGALPAYGECTGNLAPDDEIYHDGSPDPGEQLSENDAGCFHVLYPEAGWAMISVDGEEPVFLGVVARTGAVRGLETLPNALFLEVEKGVYRLRVDAPTGSRIRTAFVPASEVRQLQKNGAEPGDGSDPLAFPCGPAAAADEVDPDGIEIVIDPFADPCAPPPAAAAEEVDPDGIEIVIDPFTGRSP